MTNSREFNNFTLLRLLYPGGDVIVSLPCTNSSIVAKRLKESELIVTQPNNLFGCDFLLKDTFSKSVNNTLYNRYYRISFFFLLLLLLLKGK